MRTARFTPAVVVLRSLSVIRRNELHRKQVGSLFTLVYDRIHFSTTHQKPTPVEESRNSELNSNLFIIDPSGIAKSVFLKCSHLWKDKNVGFDNPSLKDYLLDLSTINPETIRKFWRASDLKPDDVLQILLGFKFETSKLGIGASKVRSLWGVFRWASEQGGGFRHLPHSYEIMAAALVRVGMLREIESLLSSTDNEGILLDNDEIFSNLIENYVGCGEFDKAISVYDRMRTQCLMPSEGCCLALLEFLVTKKKTQLAFSVLSDMVERELGLSIVDTYIFDNLIQLLRKDGQVNEARNLVRKVITHGMRPSDVVFDAIACGYCEKKDFDDLLKFFEESSCSPSVVSGNKAIFSLSQDFGVETAKSFLRALESLGFEPDASTFGILIGWSCHNGQLKNAFMHLSELQAKSLKPDLRSYNTLMSSLFKEGLWKHVKDILLEMGDTGVLPNMDTYRILLAGYCKVRQFEEVKFVVHEMIKHSLVQLSSSEDPLSKAFMLLGLDQLSVKVRRDNDVGLSKTEFYDSLGNGLYLDTDITKFDRVVAGVLEDNLIPDFNSLILNDNGQGNFKSGLIMVEEMARWGQELSLTAFSELVNGVAASGSGVKILSSLLEKRPQLIEQLDYETCDLLVKLLSKRGFMNNAKIVFDGMLQRFPSVHHETYSAFMSGLCKKRNWKFLLEYFQLASVYKWSPELKNFGPLINYMCQQGLIKEILELFENTFMEYHHARLHICHDFLEKLRAAGYTSTAYALVEGLQEKGFLLDHVAYSHIIRGFSNEKLISKVSNIVDIMLAKNLVPTSDILVLSIYQLCRSCNFEKAIALKELALREKSSTSDSVHTALMNGFCRAGVFLEATHIFQDMEFPDCEGCNILLQGYCQDNNMKQVKELLSFMMRHDLSISVSSYRNLVCLMCKRGDISSALNVKKLLLEVSQHSLVIYNILIFYLFRTRNSSFVEAVLDEFQEKGLQFDGVTYNFLVHGYSQCGKVLCSLQYLTSMMSAQYKPSNRSLRTIISCLCRGGEIRKALELSGEMESRGWILDSTIQNAIVETLLAEGKLEEALSFLNRVVENDLVPQNIIYDNLIKLLCGYRRTEEAVGLLNMMLKKGNIPSSSTYDCLIQGYCTCHKWANALDLLTEMLNRDLKPSINTWSKVICSACQDGQTAEAEKLLNVMIQIGETPTREVYCSLIDKYSHERNLKKASELLHMMQRDGYDPDFSTHWSLISKLKAYSRQEQ